jgi:hypothetical protein
MHELAPGLWYWSARHPHIGSLVSSYYVAEPRVLIDALIPPEGLEWFEIHGIPRHFLMSNRHHDRDAWRLREAFGCTVHCISNGLPELEGRGEVERFEFGDELPGDIKVHEIDAICPDETALYVPSLRALACADGVVREGEEDRLGFVPDHLMDEPERTKQRLRGAYGRLLDGGLDFDLLLLAHGPPVVGGARQALEDFARG